MNTRVKTTLVRLLGIGAASALLLINAASAQAVVLRSSYGTNANVLGTLSAGGDVHFDSSTAKALYLGQNGATPDTVSIGGNVSLDDNDWSITATGGAIFASLAVGAVTDTEIGHLAGVTSAIQTQLDDKASAASVANASNWDAAYGWGDHALAGYLTSESDPVFGASAAAGIVSGDISSWNTAAGLAGTALQSYTESDPVYSGSSWSSTTNNASNWDAAYGWGDHALAGYLTSESDPVYSGSSWSSTTNNASNWDAAYAWTTGFSESDPVFGSSAAAGIGGGDVSNWNAAYSFTSTFSESDPAYTGSSWASTSNNASNWDAAYGWVSVFSESDPAYSGSSWATTSNNSSDWDTAYSLASTALQSYTETDPVFGASAAVGISGGDISNWDGKAASGANSDITSLSAVSSLDSSGTTLDIGTVNATTITIGHNLPPGTSISLDSSVTNVAAGKAFRLVPGASPATSANGMMYYDSTADKFKCYESGAWTDCIAPGAAAVPAGSDMQVQFNDGGSFGADDNLTWDRTNTMLGIGTGTPSALADVYARHDYYGGDAPVLRVRNDVGLGEDIFRVYGRGRAVLDSYASGLNAQPALTINQHYASKPALAVHGSDLEMGDLDLGSTAVHLISKQMDAPSVTYGLGGDITDAWLGDGGTDVKGTVNVDIGSSGSGNWVMVSFVKPYSLPPTCVISPANTDARSNQNYTYVTSSSNDMTIHYDAVSSSGTDLWNYICIGGEIIPL